MGVDSYVTTRDAPSGLISCEVWFLVSLGIALPQGSWVARYQHVTDAGLTAGWSARNVPHVSRTANETKEPTMYGKDILPGDNIHSNVSGRPVHVLDVIDESAKRADGRIELVVRNAHGVELTMMVGPWEDVEPVGGVLVG